MTLEDRPLGPCRFRRIFQLQVPHVRALLLDTNLGRYSPTKCRRTGGLALFKLGKEGKGVLAYVSDQPN